MSIPEVPSKVRKYFRIYFRTTHVRMYFRSTKVLPYFRKYGSTKVRKYLENRILPEVQRCTCTTKLYFRTTLLYESTFESTKVQHTVRCTRVQYVYNVVRCTSVSKILSIKINNFNTRAYVYNVVQLYTCSPTTVYVYVYVYSCTRTEDLRKYSS